MGKEHQEELQERRGKGNIGASFKSQGDRECCKESGEQLWRKWGPKKIGVFFFNGNNNKFYSDWKQSSRKRKNSGERGEGRIARGRSLNKGQRPARELEQ